MQKRYDLAKFLLAVLNVILFKTCLESHYELGEKKKKKHSICANTI